MSSKRRNYSKEFKKEIAGRLINGEIASKLSVDLKISKSLLNRWKREHLKDLQDTEVEKTTEMEEQEPNSLQAGEAFGPYKVIQLLGKGGMGEVYEVFHEDLQQTFAIKLVAPELIEQSNTLNRFKEEARKSFQLNHPHIVNVDHFDSFEGKYYLRMELMNGVHTAPKENSGNENNEVCCRNLSELLDQKGGQLNENVAASYLEEILLALKYAHEQKMIHRDLKPANIMLDGNVSKIGDFGLVKAIGENVIQSKIRLSISKSRVVIRDSNQPESAESYSNKSGIQESDLSYIGTYDYMAPEQREGQEATIGSDLYSIGLIAFRMLTGKKVIGMKPVSKMVETLNPNWDDFIAKATDPDLKERYTSASEMLNALKKVFEQPQTKVDSSKKTNALPDFFKKNAKWLKIGGIASALIIMSLFGVRTISQLSENKKIDKEEEISDITESIKDEVSEETDPHPAIEPQQTVTSIQTTLEQFEREFANVERSARTHEKLISRSKESFNKNLNTKHEDIYSFVGAWKTWVKEYDKILSTNTPSELKRFASIKSFQTDRIETKNKKEKTQLKEAVSLKLNLINRYDKLSKKVVAQSSEMKKLQTDAKLYLEQGTSLKNILDSRKEMESDLSALNKQIDNLKKISDTIENDINRATKSKSISQMSHEELNILEKKLKKQEVSSNLKKANSTNTQTSDLYKKNKKLERNLRKAEQENTNSAFINLAQNSRKEFNELSNSIQKTLSKWNNYKSSIQSTLNKANKLKSSIRIAINNVASSAHAILIVKSNPSGVMITVGDQKNRTPAMFRDIPALKDLTIKGALDGYESYSDTIQLEPGETKTIGPIKMKKSQGNLTINTSPSGIRYSLNMTLNNNFSRSGITPFKEEELPAGKYELTFNYKNWPTEKKKITIHSGENRVDEMFELGSVRVTSDPVGAEVYLKGILRGTTPLLISDLIPDSYQLRLTKQGCSPKIQNITVQKNKTEDVTVLLDKFTGPQKGYNFKIEINERSNIEMKCVRSGNFMMGSENGNMSEKPVHNVRITDGYWIGKTEITQNQWNQVMGTNPSKFKGNNLPVENITWSQAMEFCNKLTNLEQEKGFLPEGYGYRLPTEAQWEYACRAGAKGSESGSTANKAWYRDNSNSESHQVGQKQANRWGIHDMLGNVMEWCMDRYDSHYYEDSESNDPTGPKFGTSRVIRGGAWNSDAFKTRSTARRGNSPQYPQNYIGFRIVLSKTN